MPRCRRRPRRNSNDENPTCSFKPRIDKRTNRARRWRHDVAEANAELDRREREKTAIHAVDPSLLKSSEWIFARNRERLLELKSEMGKQQTLIAQSNDAVGRMWFLNQMKVLDAYVEFLRRHEIFNPRCGGQLLDWIERSGNPAITIFVLEDAYDHLLCRAPAEPETPPTIITQPQSITVAPLEQARIFRRLHRLAAS